MEQHLGIIEDVIQETPLDRTFVLRVPDAPPGAFDYLPGQFVVVSDPDAEQPLRRAYSLSSAPTEGALLHMTVRDMGHFGADFYRFPKGKLLLLNPPQGRFTMPEEPSAPLLLVGAGSGVTPFRSFLVELAASGGPRQATFLQSAQQVDQLLFHKTYAALARDHDWCNYVPTVTRATDDDPWSGRRGRLDAEQIRAALEDPATTWFYACGPAAFVKAMLQVAEDLGIPKTQRKKEQWG